MKQNPSKIKSDFRFLEFCTVIPLFNDMNIVAYNKRLKNYKPLIYGVDLRKVEIAENND